VFSSVSSDMQVLGVMPTDPGQISSPKPSGRSVAAVTVFVGFGMNFLWALQVGDRLLLSNGTHRAYCLRALGITHTPCLVSRLSRDEDYELAGVPESKAEVLSYFSRRRPPLLRDFFDQRLCKVVDTYCWQNVLQLALKLEQSRIPIDFRAATQIPHPG